MCPLPPYLPLPHGKTKERTTRPIAKAFHNKRQQDQVKFSVFPSFISSCYTPYAISNRLPNGVQNGEAPETGVPCETVPPAATQPWLMTMRSSTPVWEETLVFEESYRRLLAPETLVLFELVDFAVGLSLKEARKVS